MTFETIVKESLLIFAASCVLLAILQLSGFTATEVGAVGQERFSTFADNPNMLASVLGAGLLSLIGLAYVNKSISTKLRILAWLTSGFLLISIARTGSRGNLLALILALVVLTVRPAAILERMKTILSALIIIVSLVFASYQIDAVRERWEDTYYDSDVAGRDVLLPIAWEMFLEGPIIGWGPVNHQYEMSIRMARPNYGDPHNLYLWLLNEGGFLGAFPFLIGLWLCCRSAWRAKKTVHGSLPMALLFFVLLINLKGTYLYVKLSWIVLAYALASGSYAIVSPRPYVQVFPAITRKYVHKRFSWRKVST
jgi:O-antigen ligase